jgi:hypothetical protein
MLGFGLPLLDVVIAEAEIEPDREKVSSRRERTMVKLGEGTTA